MDVTVFGGAGSVGSTVSYALATSVADVDIRIVDADTDKAKGHAIDIRNATTHLTHDPGRSFFDAHATGDERTVRAVDPSSDALAGTDCIVVVYNVTRPDSAVGRGGREEYFEQNRPVARRLGDWLSDRPPRPVVVVTNPVDRITHLLWQESGWPRQSFVGYSLSETARLAHEIGQIRDANPARVRCPVMGQHGEHVVPVFSRATIDGDPVSFSDTERERLLDYVRNVPYDVMELRGAEESSRWVSGTGVAAVVHAILSNRSLDPVCLSVPLRGEYGFENVCLSVPVVLSDTGWDRILSWDLSKWERERLDAAYDALTGQ